MVSFLLSFLSLFVSYTNSPVNFEGKIDMVYETQYDTLYYSYFVKDDNVRIDRFNKDHKLEQSLLVNLKKESIFILSPNKKLYTPVQLSNKNEANQDKYTILKTDNSRLVNGVKCYQWRVKNINRNTEVSYWVSQDSYFFFYKLIAVLNRTDKTFEFFEKIPDTEGFLPMLSVERTLLRKEKSRIFVIDISKNPLKNNLFEIPKDYQLVRR